MDVHSKIQAWLDQFNLGLEIIKTPTNTATAELAAAALGTEVGQIAKSLLFRVGNNQYVMVVTAGDVKVKSGKLKAIVGSKPKMASANEVQAVTGYSVGGVCPFDLPTQITILLDESLARFPVVYAAAGSDYSAVGVTLEQLQQITGGTVVNVTE
ncbi:MAG: YbaK/EbsC family protein [bacterium]|jgi:prolyl-tRNA editing enzyme YbaK/EbsC (Cys-tRNA(Pro) deacylase)